MLKNIKKEFTKLKNKKDKMHGLQEKPLNLKKSQIGWGCRWETGRGFLKKVQLVWMSKRNYADVR